MREHYTLRGMVLATAMATAAACSGELQTAPSEPTGAATTASADDLSALTGTLRVRCERRSGRSKISVDGNNLRPLNGRFSARVSAAGGRVTAPSKRAVGDEVEFDFDSNRNDIAAGATRISATFIARKAGPDVVGEILNAQGGVVARQGVECSFR